LVRAVHREPLVTPTDGIRPVTVTAWRAGVGAISVLGRTNPADSRRGSRRAAHPVSIEGIRTSRAMLLVRHVVLSSAGKVWAWDDQPTTPPVRQTGPVVRSICHREDSEITLSPSPPQGGCRDKACR
jgi:hypothetical protein